MNKKNDIGNLMHNYKMNKTIENRNEIYEAYKNTIKIIVTMYFKQNNQDFEDILHDSYVKLFELIDKCETVETNSVKSFFSKSIHRELLSYLRKEKVRKLDYMEEEEEEDESGFTNYSIQEELIKILQGKNNILDYIGLTYEQKAVLWLRYRMWDLDKSTVQKTMSYKDVAASVGITEYAVKKHYHEAISRLKLRLINKRDNLSELKDLTFQPTK